MITKNREDLKIILVGTMTTGSLMAGMKMKENVRITGELNTTEGLQKKRNTGESKNKKR